MVLGDVREKTREDRAEHARQQVDGAGLFAYTHDAEPKGKHTRKAKGGLKRCLRCIKVESTIFWKIVVSPIKNCATAKMKETTKKLPKCNSVPYRVQRYCFYLMYKV